MLLILKHSEWNPTTIQHNDETIYELNKWINKWMNHQEGVDNIGIDDGGGYDHHNHYYYNTYLVSFKINGANT